MKKHILKFRAVDKINFDTILDGRKTIETRANTIMYQNFQVGDVLIIKCGAGYIEKTIKKIEHFNGIDELINKVGIKNVMPLCNSIEDAKKIWYSFPGYKEKIEQFGLVAFYI